MGYRSALVLGYRSQLWGLNRPDAITLPLCIIISMMGHAALMLAITNVGGGAGAGVGGEGGRALSVRFDDKYFGSPDTVVLRKGKGGAQKLAPPSVATSMSDIEHGQLPPLLVPVHYFRPSELEEPPQSADEINVAYPDEKGAIRSGSVVLEVLINENGQVDRVNVESSDLPGDYQLAASRSFQRAEFVPGRLNGHPVKSRLRVEVSFSALISAQQ